ncbi:MAG: hypothetical protein NT029_05460 [Armatimonadetes bacterium]|nr:hypothetical protein [Armatimonadota bacterium]
MRQYVRCAVACGLGLGIGFASGYGLAQRPLGGRPNPPLAQHCATIAADNNIVYVLKGDVVYTYAPIGLDLRAGATADAGLGLQLVGTTRLGSRR